MSAAKPGASPKTYTAASGAVTLDVPIEALGHILAMMVPTVFDDTRHPPSAGVVAAADRVVAAMIADGY